MKRSLLLGYAVVAYLWFLLDIAWAIAFIADVGPVEGIDHGPAGPVWLAVVVDLTLLTIFAVHHSVMARDRSKALLAKVLPPAAERSTYVLAADVLLALVLWQWRPIDGLVWDVSGMPWRQLLWAGYGAGWLVAIASTFMIDHADFVGLRQASAGGRPGSYQAPTFRERFFYAWVRHPLMLGLLLAIWLTPRMSMGHLLFAGASTAYIYVGMQFEERDLRRHHGAEYAAYAARVPALVPRPRRSEG